MDLAPAYHLLTICWTQIKPDHLNKNDVKKDPMAAKTGR